MEPPQPCPRRGAGQSPLWGCRTRSRGCQQRPAPLAGREADSEAEARRGGHRAPGLGQTRGSGSDKELPPVYLTPGTPPAPGVTRELRPSPARPLRPFLDFTHPSDRKAPSWHCTLPPALFLTGTSSRRPSLTAQLKWSFARTRQRLPNALAPVRMIQNPARVSESQKLRAGRQHTELAVPWTLQPACQVVDWL